jgi:hypothetical protein
MQQTEWQHDLVSTKDEEEEKKLNEFALMIWLDSNHRLFTTLW